MDGSLFGDNKIDVDNRYQGTSPWRHISEQLVVNVYKPTMGIRPPKTKLRSRLSRHDIASRNGRHISLHHQEVRSICTVACLLYIYPFRKSRRMTTRTSPRQNPFIEYCQVMVRINVLAEGDGSPISLQRRQLNERAIKGSKIWKQLRYYQSEDDEDQ
jgi:hypothetical protein